AGLHRAAGAGGWDRPLRRHGAVHLWRRTALLQLSPHHPSRRARLRPDDRGDRAGLRRAGKGGHGRGAIVLRPGAGHRGGPAVTAKASPPMSRTIDYYFTLLSPGTYLGHAAFVDLARRHGCSIVYRPTPLRVVFDETGGLPLPKRHPVRQRYRILELQRWRAKRDLPLVIHPRHFPFDVSLADRVAIAISQAGGDRKSTRLNSSHV